MNKKKSINTPQLLINGNIMSWSDTMIQLSNVSCISTKPLEEIEFPKLSILLLIIGLLIFKYNTALSIILLIGVGIWIYVWYLANDARKSETILNINMNSGMNLRFIFSNGGFLNDVLQVLEKIIIEGGVGEQNVVINIHGCDISGNAKVLNDINL